MSLLRKALGAFVEFDEQKAEKDGPPQAEAEETAQPVLPDEQVNLSSDPDIQRVQEAIKLLASLPVAEIPVEKARELIVRTLEFAGMEPEMLLGSFQRALELYQTQIRTEQGLIESRTQVNTERIALLEGALKEEREQYEAEVTARNGRIGQANGYLSEIEKAMAFFAVQEEGEPET